jgi:hypothetical protein
MSDPLVEIIESVVTFLVMAFVLAVFLGTVKFIFSIFFL